MMKNKKSNNYDIETEFIEANKYLVEKLKQGRKDMKNGKGVKIAIEDTWKQAL